VVSSSPPSRGKRPAQGKVTAPPALWDTVPMRAFAKLLQIVDKTSGDLVPFKASPEQQKIWDALDHSPDAKVVVRKARQIGASTAGRAYFLRELLRTPNPHTYVCVAHVSAVSAELRKLDAMWTSQLSKLNPLLDRKLKKSSVGRTELKDTGASSISATAGHADGVRGMVFRGAHLSEIAYYADPVGMLMALGGLRGRVLIESTPNRPFDKFHELCSKAKPWDPDDPPEPGEWCIVDVWWHASPAHRLACPAGWEPTLEEVELAQELGLDNEQLNWRRAKTAEFTEAGEPGTFRFRVDYPAKPSECFLARTGSWYEPDEIGQVSARVASSPDRLCILEHPQEHEGYCIGVDIGGGVRNDYSTIVVYSVALQTVVATFRSNQIKPLDFARKIVEVATKYNNAFVLVESNSFGGPVIDRLKEVSYRALWHRDYKPWTTTEGSKQEAHAALRALIATGQLVATCQASYMELAALCVPAGKRNPEAPAGMNDDLAMAHALGAVALRDAPPSHRKVHLTPHQRAVRVRALRGLQSV
jgi:hypothetical protein